MKKAVPGLSNLRPAVQALAAELVELRRAFHRFPEPGFAEIRTAERIAAWLEQCDGFRVRTGVAQTGVVADIAGPGGREPMVLLRADMDALRIQEENPHLPYRSENRGVMHACGHDAHMAILLGVARVLSQRREALQGGVRLIFQPAEEGPGGAEPMIAAGVLEDPTPIAAFAIHVWSRLPIGEVALRPGPIMADTSELRITIRGKGGHGAVPQETVDPIVAAAHFVVALQSVVSRNVDPLDSAVLSIGKIQGGSIMNAIAEEVVLDGTMRCYRLETRERLDQRLMELGRGTDAAFGTRTKVEIFRRYPALVNHPEMTRRAAAVAETLLTPGHLTDALQLMGGEDMSFFLKEIPGCFLFLGAGNPAAGIDAPHHNPRFNIDEDALGLGAELMLRLVEEVLGPLG